MYWGWPRPNRPNRPRRPRSPDWTKDIVFVPLARQRAPIPATRGPSPNIPTSKSPAPGGPSSNPSPQGPSKIGPSPTTSGVPSNQPTTPGVPSNQPTTPGVPSNQPTTPGVPSSQPTIPGGPSNQPTTPGVPSNQPTTPGVPSNQPTTPGGPSNQPTTPGGPSNQPTTPGGPSNQPTTPGGPSNQPTTLGGPSNARATTGGPSTKPATPGGPIAKPATTGGPSKNPAPLGGPGAKPAPLGGPSNNPAPLGGPGAKPAAPVCPGTKPAAPGVPATHTGPGSNPSTPGGSGAKPTTPGVPGTTVATSGVPAIHVAPGANLATTGPCHPATAGEPGAKAPSSSEPTIKGSSPSDLGTRDPSPSTLSTKVPSPKIPTSHETSCMELNTNEQSPNKSSTRGSSPRGLKSHNSSTTSSRSHCRSPSRPSSHTGHSSRTRSPTRPSVRDFSPRRSSYYRSPSGSSNRDWSPSGHTARDRSPTIKGHSPSSRGRSPRRQYSRDRSPSPRGRSPRRHYSRGRSPRSHHSHGRSPSPRRISSPRRSHRTYSPTGHRTRGRSPGRHHRSKSRERSKSRHRRSRSRERSLSSSHQSSPHSQRFSRSPSEDTSRHGHFHKRSYSPTYRSSPSTDSRSSKRDSLRKLPGDHQNAAPDSYRSTTTDLKRPPEEPLPMPKKSILKRPKTEPSDVQIDSYSSNKETSVLSSNSQCSSGGNTLFPVHVTDVSLTNSADQITGKHLDSHTNLMQTLQAPAYQINPPLTPESTMGDQAQAQPNIIPTFGDSNQSLGAMQPLGSAAVIIPLGSNVIPLDNTDSFLSSREVKSNQYSRTGSFLQMFNKSVCESQGIPYNPSLNFSDIKRAPNQKEELLQEPAKESAKAPVETLSSILQKRYRSRSEIEEEERFLYGDGENKKPGLEYVKESPASATLGLASPAPITPTLPAPSLVAPASMTANPVSPVPSSPVHEANKQEYEKIHDLLKSIGLDIGVAEIGKLAVRTQERLHGKKATPPTSQQTPLHQPSDKNPTVSAPQHRDSAPQHRDSAPQHRDSAPQHRDSAPQHRDSASQHRDSAPQHRDSASQHRDSAPQHRDSAPQHRDSAPQQRGTAPQQRGTAPQQRGTAPQQRGTAPQQRGTAPKQRGTAPQQQNSSSRTTVSSSRTTDSKSIQIPVLTEKRKSKSPVSLANREPAPQPVPTITLKTQSCPLTNLDIEMSPVDPNASLAKPTLSPVSPAQVSGYNAFTPPPSMSSYGMSPSIYNPYPHFVTYPSTSWYPQVHQHLANVPASPFIPLTPVNRLVTHSNLRVIETSQETDKKVDAPSPSSSAPKEMSLVFPEPNSKEIEKNKVLEELEELRSELKTREETLSMLSTKVKQLHTQQGILLRKKQREKAGYNDPLLEELNNAMDNLYKQLDSLRPKLEDAHHKESQLKKMALILGAKPEEMASTTQPSQKKSTSPQKTSALCRDTRSRSRSPSEDDIKSSSDPVPKGENKSMSSSKSNADVKATGFSSPSNDIQSGSSSSASSKTNKLRSSPPKSGSDSKNLSQSRLSASPLHENKSKLLEKSSSKSSRPSEKSSKTLLTPTDQQSFDLSQLFEYYDDGFHWCEDCSSDFQTVEEFLVHLRSKKHLQTVNQANCPWAKKNVAESKMQAKQTLAVPMKGVEFLLPINGFYCQLCSELLADQTCADQHLRTFAHNDKYKKHTDDNPQYEKTRQIKKLKSQAVTEKTQQKQMELKRKISEIVSESSGEGKPKKVKKEEEEQIVKPKTKNISQPAKAEQRPPPKVDPIKRPFGKFSWGSAEGKPQLSPSSSKAESQTTRDKDKPEEGKGHGARSKNIEIKLKCKSPSGTSKMSTSLTSSTTTSSTSSTTTSSTTTTTSQTKVRPNLTLSVPLSVLKKSYAAPVNKPAPLNMFLSIKSSSTNTSRPLPVLKSSPGESTKKQDTSKSLSNSAPSGKAAETVLPKHTVNNPSLSSDMTAEKSGEILPKQAANKASSDSDMTAEKSGEILPKQAANKASSDSDMTAGKAEVLSKQSKNKPPVSSMSSGIGKLPSMSVYTAANKFPSYPFCIVANKPSQRKMYTAVPPPPQFSVGTHKDKDCAGKSLHCAPSSVKTLSTTVNPSGKEHLAEAVGGTAVSDNNAAGIPGKGHKGMSGTCHVPAVKSQDLNTNSHKALSNPVPTNPFASKPHGPSKPLPTSPAAEQKPLSASKAREMYNNTTKLNQKFKREPLSLTTSLFCQVSDTVQKDVKISSVVPQGVANKSTSEPISPVTAKVCSENAKDPPHVEQKPDASNLQEEIESYYKLISSEDDPEDLTTSEDHDVVPEDPVQIPTLPVQIKVPTPETMQTPIKTEVKPSFLDSITEEELDDSDMACEEAPEAPDVPVSKFSSISTNSYLAPIEPRPSSTLRGSSGASVDVTDICKKSPSGVDTTDIVTPNKDEVPFVSTDYSMEDLAVLTTCDSD
ncbi:zinc finger 318 isoform X1 [Pelobates cultripes]|uniref:Zinc finger 318 isoform X1 n=1 Tax=Pelobates cultripes TaxID=61616 RepID=A0AAD1VSZ8_PELCU|nr:zinc finger 318 isoform X1 [Pelobates cultripes]